MFKKIERFLNSEGVVVGLFVLVVLLLWAFLYLQIQPTVAPAHWLETSGQVDKVVVNYPIIDGEFVTGPRAILHLHFTYTVGVKSISGFERITYRLDKIRPEPPKLEEGDTFVVYYDPADPKNIIFDKNFSEKR